MTRRLVGGSGYAQPIVPADIEFAWMGNVSPSGITVMARSSDPAVTLLYADNAGMVDPVAVSGSEGNDQMWTFDVTGLTASTEYWYSFVGWDQTGRFRTFPTAGSQASFSITAASCAGSPPGGADAEYQGQGDTSNTPAWERIEDRLPTIFLNMGDWGYPDNNANTPSLYWTNYKDNVANARQASLWRNVPFAYHWSDHDYGPNDSDGTYIGRAAAQSAYRDYVPHYALPVADAIYQTFAIGRVRFFLLDVHSFRSPNADTDDASKTMLGATQKAWLKDELLAATEKVLVIGLTTPWGEPSAWGLYSTERQELANYFETNGLTDKILLLQADWHFSAFDDGTNTHYATSGSAPGSPIFHFSPMDQNQTAASGTYSEGTAFDNQMYGLLEIEDAGTVITVTGTAYACPTTTTETVALTYAHVFTV